MPADDLSLSDDALARLRTSLDGYTVDAVVDAIGEEGQAALARNHTVAAHRALRGRDDTLATLTRLFVLQQDVSWASVEAALPAREPHWVAVPAMSRLPQRWAEPLSASGALHLNSQVTRIAPDARAPARWQLHTRDTGGLQSVHTGFDAVLLALPPSSVRELLLNSKQASAAIDSLSSVDVAPCWTLMVAFPNAAQPGLQTLGPQWNAARSTHHRVAWLTRESSKPGREQIERWTVQASAAWSREHENDSAARVTAKLLKAFAEIAGIRATPAYAEVMLWRQAQTVVPLGQPYLWDGTLGIGLCGDWCTGHRVEDAFVSGLELALRVLEG